MPGSMIESPVMTVEQLLQEIRQHPEDLAFDNVMATIREYYHYNPIRFSNGLNEHRVVSEAGQNEGSCRIFAFASMHGLTESETLSCFGCFYRKDVLENPNGHDHANIRHFMRDGWPGIVFEGNALVPC